MKKFFNWIRKHKDLCLKSIYSFPILLSIIVSINHAITWFSISNPDLWSIFLSCSVEIVALTTLVALLMGKNSFTIILTFILITSIQIIANVFFSFNYIDEDGTLFKNWLKFVEIIFGEDFAWTVNKGKFWLAVISGGCVPLLSLLSLHLVTTYKAKDNIVSPNIITNNIEKEHENIIVESPKRLSIDEYIDTNNNIENVSEDKNIEVKKDKDVEVSNDNEVKKPPKKEAYYQDMGKTPEELERIPKRQRIFPKIKLRT
jgi:hypothetical protein